MSNKTPNRRVGDRRNPLSPTRDTPAAGPLAVTRNNSGRVTFDDRGNAVWQWAASADESNAEAAAARLRKLKDAPLALADPLSVADNGQLDSTLVKPNPKGVVLGYSPYDSGVLEKRRGTARKKPDLKRLGEFLKTRRQESAKKRDDDKK